MRTEKMLERSISHREKNTFSYFSNRTFIKLCVCFILMRHEG